MSIVVSRRHTDAGPVAGAWPALAEGDGRADRPRARDGAGGVDRAATTRRGDPAPALGSGPVVIRVGLVEDHHLVREGLRLVLSSEPSIEVVGEAASASEAFELAQADPDVMVVDLTLPDRDGVPLVRDLLARDARLRIVVLSMHREAETVRQALHAGAAAYVVKGARSVELVEAIRAVMRGERYLHSSVTGAIVADSLAWMEASSDLSVREREVLVSVASGRSVADTAVRLGISPNTVRRHLANISEKLGIHGTAALTRYALDHGLLRVER